MEKHVTVAIDGPSGAGKSTLAKRLAGRLGIIYVDTGALYRAVGVLVRRAEVNPDDAAAVAEVLKNAAVGLCYREGSQLVVVNGEDVTGLLRTPQVSDYASRVSVHPCVRQFLLETQRRIAREQSVIMDGRDIGTVILPDATVKIFLTASCEERAMRRYRQLVADGLESSYEEVLEEQRQRDYRDTHRAESPLSCAEDAVTVDTTGLTEEESFALLCKTVGERVQASRVL